MTDWEIWLDDPRGNRLVLLDRVLSASAVKVANGVGACAVSVPAIYDSYIKLDNIIEVWRKPAGGTLKLFNAYRLRAWEFADENNRDVTILSGPDQMDLLQSRVVAYAAGSSQASMTTYADDICKTIVSQNCATAATDADRDLSAYGITVSPLATTNSEAPSITMSFSYRNVYDVLKDVAEASRENGTPLYFELAPSYTSTTIGWEFRTYTSQPGRDRTGIDQVTFGREFGNLTRANLLFDYRDEKTVIYAGGQGLGSLRAIEEVEDTTRSGATIWNRREAFYNVASQASSTAAYAAAGQAELESKRPKMKLTGEIIDSEQARFGVDWDWGDRVMITHRGYQYEVIITSVQIAINGQGKETIRATFEVQE